MSMASIGMAAQSVNNALVVVHSGMGLLIRVSCVLGYAKVENPAPRVYPGLYSPYVSCVLAVM